MSSIYFNYSLDACLRALRYHSEDHTSQEPSEFHTSYTRLEDTSENQNSHSIYISFLGWRVDLSWIRKMLHYHSDEEDENFEFLDADQTHERDDSPPPAYVDCINHNPKYGQECKPLLQ